MLFANSAVRRVVGGFLVLLGVVLLVCFMPFWMWLALLGVILLTIGAIVLIRGFY